MLRSRDLSRHDDTDCMTRGNSSTWLAGVGGVADGGRGQGPGDDDKLGKQAQSAGLWTDLRGDYGSVALLLLLYTLQGVPMGLAASVPLLLQERGAKYMQQSLFSLVSWPFSLKLLWAPLVDSYYSVRIGRRRSWLLPTQLLCAALMIGSSSHINFYLGHLSNADAPANREGLAMGGVHDNGGGGGGEGVRAPAVFELTCIFFVLYLLMATQDIAVDGWALTMLQRRNVGWASTCNSTGQTLGYTVSFIVFMALNNPGRLAFSLLPFLCVCVCVRACATASACVRDRECVRARPRVRACVRALVYLPTHLEIQIPPPLIPRYLEICHLLTSHLAPSSLLPLLPTPGSPNVPASHFSRQHCGR